ncbi:OLC1v1002454C3 [Oldenlandia corymbosa var. corymbosa]|uniref:OLC1v1002454C3 n=1 Tax=Oldenlandia corymbosa var. corymbosa TaxID=529605 RepID=A0AAV1D7P2_OLDCO|nr:OLC1v1002454C3 [Oldenlandia corymbosa var. corymbosa]
MGQGANLRRGLVLLSLLLVFGLSEMVGAVWLNLPPSGTKCVSEEIHNNVVVLADYVVISDDHSHPTPTISTKVTSPYGNTLHQKENVTHGQFAFTTTEAGNYLACFWLDSHNTVTGDVSINIDWKTGIAAKDWDSVARKEKIEVIDGSLFQKPLVCVFHAFYLFLCINSITVVSQ